MNITFGMFLDGAKWSEKSASLGEIVCGESGFLSLLEQRTGLSGSTVSLPERINGYMQKIAAVDPVWCRASFQLDPWSSAKQLLALRDELILNGWNGVDASGERMKALAQLEASILPLAPGVPERLKMVLAELEKFSFPDTLTLQDDFSLLPFFWQKVILQLEKCGMKIVQLPPPEGKTPQIIKVTANNEFALAVELARFLSAGDNKRTALICEGKSAVLDGVLHRFGKGMIGNDQASRWRESLQILPLWLETMWKPFVPQRFMELLTLPDSPIPKVVARNLIGALQKAPGIGGKEWQEAWQKTFDTIRENKYGFYEDVEAECEKISALQDFLEKDCFNSDTGVLESTLIKRCEYLEKRLAVQVEKNPALGIVVSHIQTLKKIAIGKGLINKVSLARMLDSIVSTGTAPDFCRSQVTDFAVFSHPGMIRGDFDTVLWWNCVDKNDSGNTHWTDEEILLQPGYDRARRRKLESNAWQRAKALAKKELIVFLPQTIEGEEVYPHAMLDEPEIVKIKAVNAHSLVDADGNWGLGSRKKHLQTAEEFAPETADCIEANNISPVRRLSYSQLNTFLSCPLQWFLQDYLDLKMPPAMTLPTGGQMLGTLAHKVIEILYSGKEKISADAARDDAGRIFDSLVPEMAAELMLDGRSVERRRYRKILIEAVYSLVQEINKRNLLVKASEKQLDGSFEGIDFIGFCDLYLEDAGGKAFVIDMKWSTSGYYERNLKNNKALQLATYSWLLAPEEMDIQCAYYLFPKQQIIHDGAADWKSLWERARQCWFERMDAIHAGKLEKGVAEEGDLKESDLSLPLTAGCKFCNFAALCNLVKE